MFHDVRDRSLRSQFSYLKSFGATCQFLTMSDNCLAYEFRIWGVNWRARSKTVAGMSVWGTGPKTQHRKSCKNLLQDSGSQYPQLGLHRPLLRILAGPSDFLS